MWIMFYYVPADGNLLHVHSTLSLVHSHTILGSLSVLCISESDESASLSGDSKGTTAKSCMYGNIHGALYTHTTQILIILV